MIYRQQRDYENLQRFMFEGEGEFGIPVLQPVAECDVDNWISFNYALGCEEPEEHGVHFFVDDYQFVRVWRDPDRYLDRLKQFKAVCTPDFSPYSDFPKAIQVYNHYRKHWLGAYWQEYGINVIPTVTWSDPPTLEWCFDGEPQHSVIAMSSVGMFSDPEYTRWLLVGYERMMEVLEPTKIIWKGKIPDELAGDYESGLIVQIPSFTDKFRMAKEA